MVSYNEREEKRKAAKKMKREKKLDAVTKRLRLAVAQDPGLTAKLAKRLNKLNLVQLMSLCKENALMVGRVKKQLVERLMMCHVHGSGGECPKCGKAKLEIVYDKKEILKPISMKCKHMKGANVWCGFRKYITDETRAELLPHGLEDNEQQDLASVGVKITIVL